MTTKRFVVELSPSGLWLVTDLDRNRVIAREYAQTRALHKAARMNEAHETAEYKRNGS